MSLRHLLVLFALPTAAQAADWELDADHSSVRFSVEHLKINRITGGFRRFTGEASWSPDDASRARFSATIDAASVDTNQAQRDEALRGKDFLDVAKFPQLTFRSTEVRPLGSGRYQVTGDLTVHGVTRQVVLEGGAPSAQVKDMRGSWRMGTRATARIQRKDFGLTWNIPLESGGPFLGEEVEIQLDLEWTRPPDEVAAAIAASAIDWPVPSGWGRETILFPLSFAPELPYQGLLELRFAPGFFKRGAEDYWSYAFVWSVEGKPKLDAAVLSDQLRRYFAGLAIGNSPSSGLDPKAFRATLEPVKGTAPVSYRGQVRTHDFQRADNGKEMMNLNVTVRALECESTGRTMVVFAASPQPPNHPVWKPILERQGALRCAAAK